MNGNAHKLKGHQLNGNGYANGNGHLNGNGAVALPFPTKAAREPRRAARFAKRSLDIVLSAIALAALAPLLVVFAAAIKLSSPGPVLYRQPRIGRNGEPFAMLKFRTMVDGAHAEREKLRHLNEAGGGLFKISSDPRVTPVGRMLRKTSLDELPQLLQILTGKMSLVGPRPLVTEEDALIEGDFRHRLDVRPGLTGPWQVAGASRVPLKEMAELDLAYVHSWTVAGDLKLMVRTVPHVVLRQGI